ncbi:putative isomerase YbhE, partial [Lophiostoma macrostomum CBS 122681]
MNLQTILVLIPILLSHSMWAKTFVYVSNANSSTISRYALDEQNGALELLGNTPAGGKIMPLALSPDKTLLYGALRNVPYSVVTWTINNTTGDLYALATVPVNASYPYITTDKSGKFLLSASYDSNIVTSNRIDKAGIVTSELAGLYKTGPHAHSVVVDATNHSVYVGNLGTDRVLQLHLEENGNLSAIGKGYVQDAKDSGPRHSAISPDNRFLYNLAEMAGTIAQYRRLDDGELVHVKTYPNAVRERYSLTHGIERTNFTGDASHLIWAADIRITPDGRWLYVTERTSSTVAGYEVDESSGELTLVGFWEVEKQPRGIAVDATGSWLLVTGEKSRVVGSYRIDGQTGVLKAAGEAGCGEDANWAVTTVSKGRWVLTSTSRVRLMSAMHIGEKDGENALSWSRRSDYHADPTDNDPSDPMDVCETCRTSILDHLQYYRDSAEEYHNTLESFIESVDKGCYICRSLYLTIPSDTREVLLAKESDTYHSLKWSYHPSFSPPLISIDGLIHTSSLNIYISLYRVQDQPPGVSLVAVKSGSTGSAQPLNQICRWLENCNTHHTTCSNELGDDKPWYPTRLLDLSSTDGRARIIETIETVPKGPYVTLSHCWGTIETPRTTRENLSKFKERLPKLTKTFEDAILVARKLNVDYMWIDSLCIIQGPDLEDWASESAQMSKIYQLALCNIAATASQDGRGGLFFTRAAISPCQVEIPTFLGPDRIWLVDDGLFQREVGSAPLLQRGWVVQEFILACRVVNFSQNQIYWQCKELSASESYPNGLPRSMGVTDRNIHTEIQNLRLSRRNPSLNTVGDRVELWNMLIYRYTQSSLSKSSDKLPALSGVVNYLRDIFPGEYHAGIWQDSIHLYLTWYCVGQYGPDFRPRPAEYRAPTWSWASTDNPVKVLRELRFGDSSKDLCPEDSCSFRG